MSASRAQGPGGPRPPSRGSDLRRPQRVVPDVAATTLFDQPLTSLLSDAQFDLIRSIARRHAGIVIAEHKRSMVLRRLRRRLKALAIDSVADYCALLAGPAGPRELQPLINALTTNKTGFFREGHHFDHLRDIALPELLAAKHQSGNRRLRIWSAGCSTGEEPWSIALTVLSAIPRPHDWDIQILATDIDTEVLATAKRGIYDKGDLAPVSGALRNTYFKKCDDQSDVYEASAQLRSLMNFQPLNLHDPWPVRGPIDVIFCRNVVIYFDKPSQRVLYDRFANVLADRSFLYCGHSESLYGVSSRFESIGRSIHKRIA